MKRILFTRQIPTAHPEAGILKPGPNEIADDVLAERLLEAGRTTGDYLPMDGGPEAGHGDRTEGMPARRARKEKE